VQPALSLQSVWLMAILFVLCNTITSRNLALHSSRLCNHEPRGHVSACHTPRGPPPDHYCVTSTACRFDSGSQYKLAMLTFMIHRASTPVYLSCLITAQLCDNTLCSSTVPLMSVPFHNTDFSARDICYTAPTTWNSVPNIVTAADSLASFKSRLNTHLFNQTFIHACS